MALKKRISYRYRTFIPLVITVWVMIIAFAIWQYNNIRDNQKNQIRAQLNMISARIIDQYENDTDVTGFIDFITRYYRDSEEYSNIRLTLYKDGFAIKNFGEPIPLVREDFSKFQGLNSGASDALLMRNSDLDESENEDFIRDDPDGEAIEIIHSENGDLKQKYLFTSSVSNDGRLLVYAMLPINNLDSADFFHTNTFLIALLIVAVALTIFAFVSSHYIGRNLESLNEFARRTAEGKPIGDYKFTHDEFGDISRRIVQLYEQTVESANRATEEHIVALNAIEERARSKRQLTNNINHELRTPIGVIKGYLDTILDTPEMDEESRTHFLRKAQEHVNRLTQLISDVSAITRLEEGSDLINREELNFHDLVFTVANDLNDSGALKGLTFEYDIPLDCYVFGNYNLLAGMITNLAKNAGNYSKGTVCELFVASEDDNFYYFVFRDNGVGVGEEHLPHLFERFYRVDSGRARKAGGTGLGLPIVNNTVLVHGGEISVHNREDGETGLEFRFSLQKFPEALS